MDAAFLDLAAQCAPQVPAATIAAIVRVETDFHPFAIRLNSAAPGQAGSPRQPLSKAEAVMRAKALHLAGQDLDLGLAGVPADEIEAAGLSIEDAFEPCKSLGLAARLVDRVWRAAVKRGLKDQEAEKEALAAYYGRGEAAVGREAGYVERVLEAKSELADRLGTLSLRVSEKSLPRRERFKDAPAEPVQSASRSQADTAQEQVPVRAETAREEVPAWDVFGATRARGSSVLVFGNQKGKS
jgi:type IV secretion system protein VirB1